MDNQDLTLERRLKAKDKTIAELLEALQTCVVQIEYMHEKFSETGTGNNVISKAVEAIRKGRIACTG